MLYLHYLRGLIGKKKSLNTNLNHRQHHNNHSQFVLAVEGSNGYNTDLKIFCPINQQFLEEQRDGKTAKIHMLIRHKAIRQF